MSSVQNKLLIIFIFALVGIPSIIAATLFLSESFTKPPVIDAPEKAPGKKGGATLVEPVLCKDFQKIEGEISCDEAIARALDQYPGTAWDVFIGPAEMWVVDIQLQGTIGHFARVEIPFDVNDER